MWTFVGMDFETSSRERMTVMNILMVLTSHDRLGDTGRKTGFWLEEMAAPYYVLKEAGARITLASPKGGKASLEKMIKDGTINIA